MVQVTQTEDEIKITIELNRLLSRKPDIILLPTYIKFNNPPIFFERHLVHEIDEMSSFCRIFKSEARIVLVKKEKGIWPEMFQKYSKEDLMKKRLEIADQIVERNKERDKQAVERYENKRRTEIDKEIRRETAMRERVKKFEESACREALQTDNSKDVQGKPGTEITPKTTGIQGGVIGTSVGTAVVSSGRSISSPLVPIRNAPVAPLSAVRNAGKINVSFSSFAYATPKRESQAGIARPFVIEDAPVKENV